MTKLVIFDLDGTLVNSITDIANSVNFALDRFDFPTHEIDKYNYFVGNGTMTLIKRAIPQNILINNDKVEEVHKLFCDHYSYNYLNDTYIYEGIIELINTLKNNGYLLAVASNKPNNFTQQIINELFEKNTFNIVSGNKEKIQHKPNPQIIFDIINEIGVDKSNCLMIGDTEIDIKTGKNAGIKTCGCLWGFRKINELKNAGADIIITQPMELWDYLI